MQALGALIVKCTRDVVFICYALIALALAALYGLTRRETWVKPGDHERKQLDEACSKLWSLTQPPAGLTHHFLRLQNHLQLHYISPSAGPQSSQNLVIFLHGFPDTCYIWEKQLHSQLAEQAKLVALDLPGCGGSDNLPDYGPDSMLNAIAEAILVLRDCHGSQTGTAASCVLVSHDWGGVIASRLAAETTGLVDEVVVVNSTYPAAAKKQMVSRLHHAKEAIMRGRLYGALSMLIPVLSQLSKSYYIFMLSIPLPLARWMPWLSASLVRLCHRIAHQQSPSFSSKAISRSMAASCGPSEPEAGSHSSDGTSYSPSVRLRAGTVFPGDWDERVRIYREGLALDPWTPSYPGYEVHKQFSARESSPGRFQCPSTIIFGVQDIALDTRIVLDGIEQYLMPDSPASDHTGAMAKRRIAKLPDCGHWSMLEPDGAAAIAEAVSRAIA